MSVEVREDNRSLWVLAASPGIWAAHLMLSYIGVAIWCAKLARPMQPLGLVRLAIAALTVVALTGIAIVGWRGWKRHRLGDEPPPHDDDTPEDRTRFLGLATMLLSGLSAVAVLYAALVVVFVEDCR